MEPSRKNVLIALAIAAVAISGVFLASRGHAHRSFKFPARTTKRTVAPQSTSTGESVTVSVAATTNNLTGTALPSPAGRSADLHRRLLQAMRGKATGQRMNAIFELGQQFGAQDFSNALASAKHIPSDAVRDIFVAGLFVAQGRQQGQHVVEQLVGVKSSGANNPYDLAGVDIAFAAGGAMVGWAETDPRAALAFAKQNVADDAMFPRLAYGGYGALHLDAMLADANVLPDGVANVPGQDNFMTWAKADPDRAVDYALTLDEYMRTIVLDRIAQGWATDWSTDYRPNFTSYLNLALEGDPDKFMSQATMQWWTASDPQSAVEYVATIEDTNKRDEHLDNALPVWLTSNPDAALDWLKTYIAQHDDAKSLPQQLINQLDEVNPEMAAQILTAFPDLVTDANARADIIAKWMKLDPLAAFDWATQTGTDPAALLTDTREAALNLALWSVDDALNWSQHLPDDASRQAALAGVALGEGYTDDNTPTDWMLALPAGTERDRVVFDYVTGCVAHAGGQSSPDESILTKPVSSVSDLANEVQKSKLDDAQKQRLLALVYGWPANH